MDHTICPGSKLIRSPKPETLVCPQCRIEVEIWSDEMRASCPSCKQYVVRESFGSCLDWCKMGKECVGSETYDRYMNQRTGLVKSEILKEMESFFGKDCTRQESAAPCGRTAEE